MGLISFKYGDPASTGTDAPSKGYLEASLLHRETVDGGYRTTHSFIVPLVDGEASVLLSDTGVGQCWMVREGSEIRGAATRYVIVAGDADFSALVDVDPTTLQPSDMSLAGWTITLAAVQLLASAADLDAAAALGSAGTATAKAAEAVTSAATASTKAGEASTSASGAAGSASSASGSAGTATTKAAEAETARAAAVVAKTAAEAVPTATDGIVTALDGNPASAFRTQSDARRLSEDADADSDLREQQDARLTATFAPGVSIKCSGAVKGDGVTDDTTAINAVITANGGKNIHIPAGTYMVNAVAAVGASSQPVGVKLNQPGTRLIFAPGAIFKAITTNQTNYAIIQVTAADCEIIGGTLLGDLATHTGSTGEWGHCLDVNIGAHRLIVTNTNLNAAWGDGCQVMGRPVDVSFVNVHADGNRRQGLSVIDAVRFRVLGGAYTNTTGAPGTVGLGCGILLEPDADTARDVIDAIVSGAMLAGNAGPGLATSSNGRTLTATVSGCRAAGNGVAYTNPGFRIYGATNDTIFTNCTSTGNSLDGFTTESDCVGVIFNGCVAISNARFGFSDTSSRTTMNGCTAARNVGTGFYLSPGASNTKMSSCVAHSNCSSATFDVQVDVQGTNAHLVGVISDSGTTTPNFGFVVRTTGTGARLISCTASGTFGSGAALDLTSAAYIFPKIGAVTAAAITSPTADVTSLKNTVDVIRVALQAAGICR